MNSEQVFDVAFLPRQKRIFVYQDKGAFFECCLPSTNDVSYDNDDGFATFDGKHHIIAECSEATSIAKIHTG